MTGLAEQFGNPQALTHGFLGQVANPQALTHGLLGQVAKIANPATQGAMPNPAPYAGTVKTGVHDYLTTFGSSRIAILMVILSLFVIAYIVLIIVLMYVMARLMRRSLRLIVKKQYASGFSQGILGFFGMILVISAVVFSPVSIAASYTEEIGAFIEEYL